MASLLFQSDIFLHRIFSSLLKFNPSYIGFPPTPWIYHKSVWVWKKSYICIIVFALNTKSYVLSTRNLCRLVENMIHPLTDYEDTGSDIFIAICSRICPVKTGQVFTSFYFGQFLLCHISLNGFIYYSFIHSFYCSFVW